MKLTKKILKAAAIDLNDTAGLEPEIGYDADTEKNILSKLDVDELKEWILNEAGEFRKTDKYKDQTWDVLVELGVEIAVERAADDEPAPKSKKAVGKKATKTKPTPAKKATVKKLGVVATILSLISAKPMTKDSIVAELVKKFPDRQENSMRSTVNVQIPGRVWPEIVKDSKDRYGVK